MRLSRASGRVLLEGHNLTLAAGTGIATYARVLGQTVQDLGYTPEVLIGAARGLDRKDPILTEINFYDVARDRNLGQRIAAEWRRLSMLPIAVKPFELPQLGTVVGPAAERFAGFAGVHAVTHLEERERFHFKRFGKPLRVKLAVPPQLFHATRPCPLQVEGCPNIYTLHDIVPLRLPYTTADDKKLYLGMIRELCQRADHIVTVSEFSRQDIIRLTGISKDRITNTYQAVKIPARLMARSEAEVAADLEAIFGLEHRDYFLFVGAIEPKKNISRLIDAYAASGVRRPLVVAGGLGWMYEKDLEKIQSERFLSYVVDGQVIKPRRSVRREPYLPFEHLITLLRGARAVLFPSIYEGFGLPVLEAMALGTPVMTSNVSALPEIAGDAAELIDPYDVEAMAGSIRKLDADDDRRAELSTLGPQRAAFFAPERYAKTISSLYERIIHGS